MTAGLSAGYRLRRVTAVVAGILVGMLSIPVAAEAQETSGNVQLPASDAALLNGVRLAGLWEMPAGAMAARKGNLARVREIGAEIEKQHEELDKLCVDAANELGVTLPEEPTAKQKEWLDEMRLANGARFDRTFVERLRAAHGAIYPVIAAVRSGTRNETVRKLAIESEKFVADHMDMLESTGLVNYNSLPGVPLPPNPDDSLIGRATAVTPPGTSLNGPIVWVILLAALAVGGVATVRMMRARA